MPKDKNANAIQLIGSPESLINQVIKDAESRAWALQKITAEGPPHKQVQHTLVLTQLKKLAALHKKAAGKALKYTKGRTISIKGPGGDVALPVSIPKKSLEGLPAPDQVLEQLSRGPVHEALYTAILLQLIEAMIAAHESTLA